jgi:hypothetical protein
LCSDTTECEDHYRSQDAQDRYYDQEFDQGKAEFDRIPFHSRSAISLAAHALFLSSGERGLLGFAWATRGWSTGIGPFSRSFPTENHFTLKTYRRSHNAKRTSAQQSTNSQRGTGRTTWLATPLGRRTFTVRVPNVHWFRKRHKRIEG